MARMDEYTSAQEMLKQFLNIRGYAAVCLNGSMNREERLFRERLEKKEQACPEFVPLLLLCLDGSADHE